MAVSRQPSAVSRQPSAVLALAGGVVAITMGDPAAPFASRLGEMRALQLLIAVNALAALPVASLFLQMKASEERYRGIIDQLSDVYYRTDRDGIITMLSPSTAEMFGFASIREIIGRSPSFRPRSSPRPTACWWWTVRAG